MELNAIPPAQLPVLEPRVQAAQRDRRQQGNDPVQAKKVAREFEAMFVGMMLKSMRETVGKDKLTGGGHGEETFRSLLDQEYAQAAVKSGGIGLAAQIERELTRGTASRPRLKEEGHAD